jgi:hypothetical protein
MASLAVSASLTVTICWWWHGESMSGTSAVSSCCTVQHGRIKQLLQLTTHTELVCMRGCPICWAFCGERLLHCTAHSSYCTEQHIQLLQHTTHTIGVPAWLPVLDCSVYMGYGIGTCLNSSSTHSSSLADMYVQKNCMPRQSAYCNAADPFTHMARMGPPPPLPTYALRLL